MSLSSSLFTGTSGLTNMGNAMQVVGNNISNVNTVGFKAGRTTFADTLSQTVATTSGSDQVGRGMSIGSVDQTFDTGSFESTGNSTDLSIGGDGFFVVRQATVKIRFIPGPAIFILTTAASWSIRRVTLSRGGSLTKRPGRISVPSRIS